MMVLSKVGGFSLLEVVLALAIATSSFIVAQQLAHGLWLRGQWWQTLAQVSARQAEAVSSLVRLHAGYCAAGLARAGEQHWQLRLDQGRGCQLIDMRYNGTKQQLQKRRAGGRYSAFLHAIVDVQVHYALALAGHCQPHRWVTRVAVDDVQRVVLLQVQVNVVVNGVGQPMAVPDDWQWQANDSEPSLQVPVKVLIPLGCQGHA